MILVFIHAKQMHHPASLLPRSPSLGAASWRSTGGGATGDADPTRPRASRCAACWRCPAVRPVAAEGGWVMQGHGGLLGVMGGSWGVMGGREGSWGS